MKTVKILLILAAIVCLLSFNLFGCSWVDDNRAPGSNSGRSTPHPAGLLAHSLTATYGADQFHTQLTAIANSQVMGSKTGNP